MKTKNQNVSIDDDDDDETVKEGKGRDFEGVCVFVC